MAAFVSLPSVWKQLGLSNNASRVGAVRGAARLDRRGGTELLGPLSGFSTCPGGEILPDLTIDRFGHKPDRSVHQSDHDATRMVATAGDGRKRCQIVASAFSHVGEVNVVLYPADVTQHLRVGRERCGKRGLVRSPINPFGVSSIAFEASGKRTNLSGLGRPRQIAIEPRIAQVRIPGLDFGKAERVAQAIQNVAKAT